MIDGALFFVFLLLVDAVEEGEDLGDGLVEFVGNLGVEVEFGENGDEVWILPNWDSVLFGQFDDASGQFSLTLRHDPGCGIVLRAIANDCRGFSIAVGCGTIAQAA